MVMTAPKGKMSAQDLRWRAEDDARTLAEASAIRKDKSRLKRAAQAAKTMAEEAQARATGMRSVANIKVKK